MNINRYTIRLLILVYCFVQTPLLNSMIHHKIKIKTTKECSKSCLICDNINDKNRKCLYPECTFLTKSKNNLLDAIRRHTLNMHLNETKKTKLCKKCNDFFKRNHFTNSKNSNQEKKYHLK